MLQRMAVPSCALPLASGMLLTPPGTVLICIGYVKSSGPWELETDVDPGTPIIVVGVMLLLVGLVLALVGVYRLANELAALRGRRVPPGVQDWLGALRVTPAPGPPTVSSPDVPRT